MSDVFEGISPFTPPAHLFAVRMVREVKPKEGATIRVRVQRPEFWQTPDADLPAAFFRHVKLYEYHPDYDPRLKFRGYALTELQRDLLTDGNFTSCGEGYLDEPYMLVSETAIHEEDNAALRRWCQAYNSYAPLVIAHCPLPFPMWSRGDRVRVVSVTNPQLAEYYAAPARLIGELATCTKASSAGGMSTIRFDRDELNRGFTDVGFWSIDLRKVEERHVTVH